MIHTAVTIGTFDGIHLGHKALLERTRKLANTRGLKSLVLTFPLPPQNYLGDPKKLLLPKGKRIELLKLQADQVVVIDFSDIRMLKPQEFITRILKERLGAAAVVVGRNFRFGHDRQGNASMLQELGQKLGMEVEIVEPVTVDGEVVSSTAIREALQTGEVERAARLLGDAPRLWGRVIPGEGQGRALGFPTANLSIDPEVLLPAEGIYAARVLHREFIRMGALYIGRRPTLDGTKLSLEVHILDLEDTNLYGEELEVQLLTRLRADQRFASISELQEKIQTDMEAIRALSSRFTQAPRPQ